MRKTQIGAIVSSAALMTTLTGQMAWGATSQSSVCATFQNDLVAFDAAVNADSAVRAADAAYVKAKLYAARAYKLDRLAAVSLSKARATKNKAKIAKALAAYNKAHATRVSAGRLVAATKARADYTRAVTWQQLKSVVDAACLQPPANLAASVSSGDVSLSWSGPTDVAGYRVFRNGVLVATVTSTTFSFDDTSVKNGTTYNYMVRSFVFDAESQDSNVIVATPTLPPPTDLNATPGDARVALTWSSVAGATSYQVWRNGSQITTRTSTSYNDTGLTNGTTYTYRVRAVAGSSVSGDSDSVDAKPVAAVANPPAAPTNLVATAGAGKVDLTWTASSGATGYKVLRGGTQIATSTTTSYSDTTGTPGQQYTYTVVATNGAGSSGSSSSSTATPNPAAPTGFTAVGGDTTVALSWTASPGATGYQVFRNGAQIATPTTTSFGDTGLTNGVAYTYTVRTVVGTLVSADSTAQTVTPSVAPVAPLAPTNLVATPGVAKVTLTWAASSGATGYKVLRGATQIGTTTTATTYTDSTAVVGTSYSYTVVATNTVGSSPASTAATATAVPAAPTGFTAVAGDTSAALSWTAVTGATGYQVFRNSIQIATPTTTTFNDSGLVDGTAYTYTVRAVAGTAVSADSTAQTVTPNKVSMLAAPTGVVADSATNLNTGALRLTWTAVTGATGYSVYSDGTLLGTSTTTTYTPTAPAYAAMHAYTVMATNGTPALNSPQSTAVSAAVYQGTSVADSLGRTTYGNIQAYIVVTQAATKTITGCWATYPTTSDSGQINPRAIPTLCSRTLTAQPTSANVTTAITNASGASATSPAFKTSLQQALILAGM